MSNRRYIRKKRYKRVNTCAECGMCKTGMACKDARRELRSYNGVRFTADGFDCALPVTIDSHSVCAYGCLYCFSDNLIQHRNNAGVSAQIGQTELKYIERIFAGAGDENSMENIIRQALKYDDRNADGYPMPVQLGGITDPCDTIERQQGWLLEFIKLAIKYRQPVRISTKGNIFRTKEYIDAVGKAPELFWVAFSTISVDDEMLEKIDRRAPNATERLATMKVLSDIGCSTSLRFRPIMPGISDSTKKHPKAYKELIERSKEAGAKAISYEVVFTPGRATPDIKHRWKVIEKIIGVPMTRIYESFGDNQACIRPAYGWTEQIMHAVKEEAVKNDMTVGVSDPVWKQLTDTGCCCGILPDDKVFGNWQRESATNQLLLAKNEGKILKAEDIIPKWAYRKKVVGIYNPGVGAKVAYLTRHKMWSDKLREIWNGIDKERSPLNYFQGALEPVSRKDGEWSYKYVGLKRQNPKNTPYWRI